MGKRRTVTARMELEELGKRCKLYRVLHGYRQIDVANDLGCEPENVSMFESGKNDNVLIFMWYIRHGMQIGDE